MRGPVLIVEDDKEIRETLREILSEEGHTVACARDGVDALGMLSSSAVEPALILLDLLMPVMDGYTFRARQLADPRWRRIPVVVMTAHGDPERVSVALQAPVLLKPFEVHELWEHLQRAFEARPDSDARTPRRPSWFDDARARRRAADQQLRDRALAKSRAHCRRHRMPKRAQRGGFDD